MNFSRKWVRFWATESGRHLVGYTTDMPRKAIWEEHKGLRSLKLEDPLIRRDVEKELSRRNRKRKRMLK